MVLLETPLDQRFPRALSIALLLDLVAMLETLDGVSISIVPASLRSSYELAHLLPAGIDIRTNMAPILSTQLVHALVRDQFETALVLATDLIPGSPRDIATCLSLAGATSVGIGMDLVGLVFLSFSPAAMLQAIQQSACTFEHLQLGAREQQVHGSLPRGMTSKICPRQRRLSSVESVAVLASISESLPGVLPRTTESLAGLN